MQIIIKRSDRKGKKFMAVIFDGPKKRTVHFGQAGAQHYTQGHLDVERKERYIKRHEKREKKFWDFNIDNVYKPSFWSRWFTWEKKTYKEAKKFIMNKLNVNIK